MDEKKQYLIRTKRILSRTGFQCMILSMALLLFIFIFCRNGQVGSIYMPETLYWWLQRFNTFAFVWGAVGYLVSLTINIENIEKEDEE